MAFNYVSAAVWRWLLDFLLRDIHQPEPWGGVHVLTSSGARERSHGTRKRGTDGWSESRHSGRSELWQVEGLYLCTGWDLSPQPCIGSGRESW